MASGNTVTLTFAGDDRNLSRVLAGLSGKTAKAEQSVRKFGTGVALAFPAVGLAAGAVVGLSGAMGVLPSMAFAGALGMGALAIGMQGFGDAMSNMDDPAKFAEAIAKLSPAARETAVAIRDLKPQFDGLRQSVQQQLFSGIAGELRLLTGALLPTLNTQLGLSAGSFNRTALSFMGWLRIPSTVTDINTALGGSQAFLDGLLRALLPVSKAFLDMGVVAAPYMRQLGDAIANGATKFGEFIGHARETGQLGTWIETGKQAFLSIWETIKNLALTVRDLGIAFGPTLLGALQLVSGALAAVAGFIRDNQAVMVPLLSTVAGLVLVFKGFMVVQGVMAAFRNATLLAAAAQWLFNAAMWANPMTWIVIAVVALIAAIVLLVVHWDKVKIAAMAAITWIKVGWGALVGWLAGIWASIKAAALAAWTAVTTWIGTKIGQALAFIDRLAAIPGKVGAWFGQMKDRAVALAGQLVSWLAGLPGRIWSAIGALAGLAGRVGAWFAGMVRAGIAKGAELAGWMRGLPGRIMSALGNLGSLLVSAGRDVVNGLWRGIQAGWSWITGAVRNLASSLLSAAKGALGIASPSKLFRDEVGRWIPEGMAVGITANTGDVIRAARALGDLAAVNATPAMPSAGFSGASSALSGIRSSTPAAAPRTHVTVNVQGSILSERELVSLIRDEFDRGGFRGVRSTR